MSACQCHPCGRHFTGLTAFDKHQDVDYTRQPEVRCIDPAALGMVQNPHGRWGYPMSDDRREQLKALRAGDAEHAPAV